MQTILGGIGTGSVYALLGLAFALVFGRLKICSYMHGDLAILAAFLGFSTFSRMGIDPLITLVVLVPLFFGLGYLVQSIFMKPFMAMEIWQGRYQAQVMVTWGLAMAVMAVEYIVWSGTYRTLSVPYRNQVASLGDLKMPVVHIMSILAVALIYLALQLILKKTDLGISLRACSDDRVSAMLTGINYQRVCAVAFGISASIAVVAKNDMMMFCIAADSYVANDSYGQNIVNIQMDDQWRGGMWWHDVAEFFVNFDQWNTKGLERPKTVAILNLEISYGHEVADSIVPYLEDNGFEIVYHEYFDPMQADWTPIVSRMKELQPDIIFQPHYFEDCVKFIEKCKELDYYAPYMIIEGMGWDTLSWTNPEFGGLDPSVAKRGFFAYSVYKNKYQTETSKYLADYVKEKYDSIPGNDLICGFMAVELAAKAANMAGSVETADLKKVLTENTFDLAGYAYTMNETGGNAADFNWGVGQYIPDDINNADVGANDWYCVWPEKYKEKDPMYPFPGWK